MLDTLELAQDLIRYDSVTPHDKGCQKLLINLLSVIGFKIEHLRFGRKKFFIDNIWARHGIRSPIFAFAGHTDVVPTGPMELWRSEPFNPKISDGLLYGRGAADMKGSIAAMVTACERFISKYPDHNGSIALLITGDEEGPATEGTVKVIEILEARNEKINWCVVGEPSSIKKIGDVIRNGRRGSLNGYLTVKGKQGHIAYPQLAKNPIHLITPALNEFCSITWDQGNEYFPPTSFQISNIHSGIGVTNMIPFMTKIIFNFRYSTEITYEQLQSSFENILDKYSLNYDLEWQLSGKPFYTSTNATLINSVNNAIKSVTGYHAQLSTSGGTSDGRFIAPTGAQVVELGPLNSTIHQTDECVSINDIKILSKIYRTLLKNLLIN